MSSTPLMFAADEEHALQECGACRRDGRLYAGAEAIEFTGGAQDLGRDGYRIARRDGVAHIAAATRTARLAAVLELQDMQARRLHSVTRRLRFNHRNYKHEVIPLPNVPHSIERYTEKFWADICRELVRRHFNGIVFYMTENPLLLLGDYGPFAAYAPLPADTRRHYRDIFNMILRVSHRYGLETHMQQYMTFCPSKLSRKIGLPLFDRQDPLATIADFRHPLLYRFQRELYSRFFDVCPGLDRLMLNFESAPVSSEFIRELLLPTLAKLPRVPDLFMRLWYMTNPRELCDWIEQYPGHCMVGHKIIDTMDAYNYPAPDSRILEWKAYFRKRKMDVEWNYLVGPCHNCGSNISGRLWSDPEFVYTLLKRAAALGTDGINFHTRMELLAHVVDSAGILDDQEIELAHGNQMHLEAAVDFVRGHGFNEERVIDWHAMHFNLPKPKARRAYRVLRDSSRAEVLHLQQFPLTTQEGYAVESRRQLTQQPFFYLPVSTLHNRQHTEDPHPYWCYVNKTIAHRSYPADLQPVIDYVNPEKAKTRRNPDALAREMETLGSRAFKQASSLRRELGPVCMKELESNRDLAWACARDIHAGIDLFRLYFVEDRKAAIRQTDRAVEELTRLNALVQAKGSPYVHMKDAYKPEPDIAALKRLRHHLARPYPFEAFQAYACSRQLYNEIRRHVRPWRVWSPQTLEKAGRLLDQAHHHAVNALDLCGQAPMAACVARWVDFLGQEIANLTPPQFLCTPQGSEWQPMTHDNCFGYGGFAWADFLAFFEPLPFDKGQKLFCSVQHTSRALLLRVREDDVDMPRRAAHWKAQHNLTNLCGFMRLFFDINGDGKRLQNWAFFPRGSHAIYRELLCNGRQDFNLLASRIATGWQADYQADARSWMLTLTLPFAMLGAKPQANDTWRFNLAANTAIARNHGMAWCKGYEVGPGNPARMGLIRFR